MGCWDQIVGVSIRDWVVNYTVVSWSLIHDIQYWCILSASGILDSRVSMCMLDLGEMSLMFLEVLN